MLEVEACPPAAAETPLDEPLAPGTAPTLEVEVAVKLENKELMFMLCAPCDRTATGRET
jgi:hypothetical protein